VNQFKPKNADYDFLFNADMINFEKIIEVNNNLIAKFIRNK